MINAPWYGTSTMQILILSEANVDKYYAIINDIISREMKGDPETKGVVLDICNFIGDVIDLDSENKIGRLLNKTYKDYKKYTWAHFNSLGMEYVELKKKDICNFPFDARIIDEIIIKTGTTTFASVHAKTKLFESYPHRKRKLLFKTLSNLCSQYSKLISGQVYDKVFIPSGKNAWGALLSEIIKRSNCETQIYFYDSFGTEKTYFCEKYKPTDLHSLQEAILNVGELNQEKRDIAETWFRRQSQSRSQNFYLNIKPFELHEKNNNRIVTYFTSSEDEFIGLEDWSRSSFLNQYDSIKEAAQYFYSRTDVKWLFVVRFHPHLRYKSLLDNIKVAKLSLELNKLGCKVLLPHEKVSATSLVEKSEKVLVWNSTVGIESSKVGASMYHLADAIYSGLGAGIHVENILDFEKTIPSRVRKENSLAYGYYMATTSYEIESWIFYPKKRYVTRLHYYLFGNHNGLRNQITMKLNFVLFLSVKYMFLWKK